MVVDKEKLKENIFHMEQYGAEGAVGILAKDTSGKPIEGASVRLGFSQPDPCAHTGIVEGKTDKNVFFSVKETPLCGFDDLNDVLVDFAFGDGPWIGFADILREIVKENFRVRNSIDGEKTVQSTVVALLCAAAGPYFVHHGGEAGGGFYDIALEPQLSRWPDIAHAALIELKYLKPGDPQPTPEALAAIKAEAIDQLDRYCADPALVAKFHLKRDASSLKARSADFQPAGQYTAAAGGDLQPEGRFKAEGGTVSLHRLVLVFKGGDCILHEEV